MIPQCLLLLKVQLAGRVEGEAVHDGAGGGADDPAGGHGAGDAGAKGPFTYDV